MFDPILVLAGLIGIGGFLLFAKKRPKSRGERASKKGNPNAGKGKSGPQPQPQTSR